MGGFAVELASAQVEIRFLVFSEGGGEVFARDEADSCGLTVADGKRREGEGREVDRTEPGAEGWNLCVAGSMGKLDRKSVV